MIFRSMVILTVLLPLKLWASAPGYVNFQGYLKDEQGQNLSNGIYSLRFAVYESGVPPIINPENEIAVWGPQYFDDNGGAGHGAKVVVVNGHFNVILGPQDDGSENGSIPRNLSSAFVQENRFIEISICSAIDCEDQDYVSILPRQQFLTAPYAFNSNYALFSEYAYKAVPVGTIVASLLTEDQYLNAAGDSVEAPTELRWWVLADGRAVPGSDYSEISGESNVPDLQGMFLRGLDTAGTQDPDGPSRILGGLQMDALTEHVHTQSRLRVTGNFWQHHPENSGVSGHGSNGVRLYDDLPTSSPLLGEGGEPLLATESRPKNIAVNYFIRINSR